MRLHSRSTRGVGWTKEDPMRARGWRARARSLAISLGSLAALLVAGVANWPHH
jgi:hypothetical protein